ncbi:MAG: XRE family transcriptional regulator [Oscillospiraceae bacterium]|jgi:hypothetical protein|nr:XRE family transcriptional regulator [Oscillospiraceae bacterium]
MTYSLRHFDTELLRFTMGRKDGAFTVRVLEVQEENVPLLPLGVQPTDSALAQWLEHRRIPVHRAFVESFLAKQGISERDTAAILRVSKALSLNDAYWICAEDEHTTFAQVNLYQNPFNRFLSAIAYTGYGTVTGGGGFRSSPEFTTGGMLAKSWRRMGGEILLYKSGTQGASNAGNEPYAEFYAAQVAVAMGLPHVSYGLAKWKGRLCSTCALFTSIDRAFVGAHQLIPSGNINAALAFYAQEGYREELLNMLLFDALVCNQDRHFGNFGFLVDAHSNRIVDTAPIFDNGLSLFCYAMDDALDDLHAYAKTRLPSSYDDFVDFSRSHMTEGQRRKLRKLTHFSFQKHPRYNWSAARLKAIEQFIRERAALLAAS